jgi:hypothetical protein
MSNDKTPDISPLPKSALPFRTSILRASNGYAIFQAEPGNYVAYVKDIQDANFIVEACNNYHRLEAENKALREAQAFIPLKDKKPEVGKMVLCLTDEYDYELGMLTDSGVFEDREGNWSEGVTHWKPLPPPPKEDGV